MSSRSKGVMYWVLRRLIRSRVRPSPAVSAALTPSTSRPSIRSEEHTSELQSRLHLVCCLLLEKKKAFPAYGKYSSPSSQRLAEYLPRISEVDANDTTQTSSLASDGRLHGSYAEAVTRLDDNK